MTRAGDGKLEGKGARTDVDRASKPEKTRAQVTDDSKALDLSMHHPSDGVDTSVRAQKCQNVLGMCLNAPVKAVTHDFCGDSVEHSMNHNHATPT